MADAEEVLWTDEAAPTAAGVDDLRRSFAQRIAELLPPREISDELGTALAEIGAHVAGRADSATRLIAELKRHHTAWTLVLADDGTPLLRETGRLCAAGPSQHDPLPELGRGLPIVLSRFAQHLYVPRNWRSPGADAVNRLMIRAAPAAGTRPRILVVDDDPVQRLTIELFLRDEYATVACAGAAEAELEARLQTPDIIISDIHMPDEDGIAFRDRLTRESELGQVPFLFLTSDRSPGASAAANETGIDDLLYKPLDKRRLLSVLDRILKRQRQLKSLRRHDERAAVVAMRLPCRPLPERVGRYAIAARHIATDRPVEADIGRGGLLWHRQTPSGLQVLICDDIGAGTWPLAVAHLGFVKGAAQGMGCEIGPSAFIETLSDLLGEEGLLDGEGLTAVGCWLGADGVVAMANAGQPPPLLVGAGGVREVPVEGDRIGSAPGQKYGSRGITLAPGERLVFITNGFVGRADCALVRPGMHALREILNDLVGRPPSVIAESIVRGHLMRSGGRAPDGGLVCVIGFD